MPLTAGQVRAARAMLRIGQQEVADAAHVSLPTIQRIEAQEGEILATTKRVNAIQRAFEARGIVFTETGVELRRKD